MLDDKDRLILRELERNCRQRTNEIARQTNIPITTVHNRIKKLHNSGHITNFRAVLDPERMGKPLLAFVFVTLNRHPPENTTPTKDRDVIVHIASHPSVLEVHTVTGDWDLLLKVRAKNMPELEEFITKHLRDTRFVERAQTICALRSHKETTNLLYNGIP